ncbi:GH10455 [Drosophila grimshawi]|uniref:GH10455 n=1 Tax=Drosophila grimshawi TaxID=7222 RepID=B4JE06_DROGR|nr:GH10455 [Drosophila grimshawi]
MMLHEAVMLEIYRQALSASELASPRCQSRESNASAAAGDARCPSNESHCSANDCLTPAPTPTPTASSPVGLPLTATLAPSAAAALLPPQSAAMAAYLAAAQQNHLLLTNPLAAAASLVQQATSTSHQERDREREQEPEEEEEAEVPALDFSRKRNSSDCEAATGSEEEPEQEPDADAAEVDHESAPLDLSVSTRKRQTPSLEQEAPVHKQPRGTDYKSPLPLPPGSWVPPINPYLAAVAAKSAKMAPSEASKALEKMSEMSRRETPPPPPPTNRVGGGAGAGGGAGGGSGGGRHSAWQSHWLNKGADAAKDVFKCVWCKQSFASLALLTTHMKETQHCGVQVPSPSPAEGRGQATPRTSSTSSGSASSSSSSSNSTSSVKSELNMLIKETMPLPRKLVRGQDVWLGKGAEQTRQILKCMWCGQSFRSLAEMTSHMQETQHYTNIISQEQIISWKSGDERAPNGSQTQAGSAGATAAAPATPTVSAVLTCKVCDQAFGTLKELSTHMAQQSHYKDAGSSCSAVAVSPPPLPNAKRGRQPRNEKRKKSLPVRKLLELERSSSNCSLDSALKPLRDFAAATKITCEKCGTKIETALFVEHIRKCLGESMPIPPRRQQHQQQQQATAAQQEQRLLSSPPGKPNSSGSPSVLNALEQLIEKSFESRVGRLAGHAGGYSESGTPLGASILKRLGIDDSSDYTKPLMDAQTMHMQLLRSSSSASSYQARDRSASESSTASRVESAYTPDRQLPTPRRTPDTPVATPTTTLPAPPSCSSSNSNTTNTTTTIKSEPLEPADTYELETSSSLSRHLINVKKEFSMEQPMANPRESPSASSERSNTSPQPAAPPAAHPPSALAESGSLLALNSMFDQLSNVETNNNNTGHCFNNNNNNNSSNNNNNNNASATNKKPKAHPLAALQKLCETTDPPASNTRSASSSSSSTGGVGNGGSDLVAFSWACNEAVLSASAGLTGGDSIIIKCSFCDTPFGSKGAYRHHLSKVHFVKDTISNNTNSNSTNTSTTTGAESSSPPLKSPAAAHSPKTLPLASPKRSASRSPAAAAQQQQLLQQQLPQNSPSPYDESPQSKFLKYTELAKQLSSKNA